MKILYDNAATSKTPVQWNMQEVMTVLSVLGVAGVITWFLLNDFIKVWVFKWLKNNNTKEIFVN